MSKAGPAVLLLCANDEWAEPCPALLYSLGRILRERGSQHSNARLSSITLSVPWARLMEAVATFGYRCANSRLCAIKGGTNLEDTSLAVLAPVPVTSPRNDR